MNILHPKRYDPYGIKKMTSTTYELIDPKPSYKTLEVNHLSELTTLKVEFETETVVGWRR